MKKFTIYAASLMAVQISCASLTAETIVVSTSQSPTPAGRTAIPLNAETAVVYVRNENKDPINVLFKPQIIEEDPSVNSENRIKDLRAAGFMSVKIPGNSFIQVIVKQKDLGKDVNLFSATGEADCSGPVGVANNLSYGKVYVVKFTENAFGTTCFTEELKGPIKDFPQVQAAGVEVRKELPRQGGTPLPQHPYDVRPGATN